MRYAPNSLGLACLVCVLAVATVTFGSNAIQIAKLGDAVDLLFCALGEETRGKPNGRAARWL